jgi:beta-phosphoglucomutase-like phosphatase (HAD superfamily)
MIVSAEDVSKHKPDPECYLLGFEAINKVRALEGLLAVHPHECLVIEDAPQGVVAGKRAGMKTIGVVNTVPEDRMREVAADAVAKDIADWMPESIRRVFV